MHADTHRGSPRKHLSDNGSLKPRCRIGHHAGVTRSEIWRFLRWIQAYFQPTCHVSTIAVLEMSPLPTWRFSRFQCNPQPHAPALTSTVEVVVAGQGTRDRADLVRLTEALTGTFGAGAILRSHSQSSCCHLPARTVLLYPHHIANDFGVRDIFPQRQVQFVQVVAEPLP